METGDGHLDTRDSSVGTFLVQTQTGDRPVLADTLTEDRPILTDRPVHNRLTEDSPMLTD